VNAHGISPNRPLLQANEAEWDRTFAVNTRGTMLTCRAVGNQMIDRGSHGALVNVSSGAATSARLGAADPSLAPYMRMMLDMTPLGRTGSPADIAEVILFVASERNAWMTGSIVDVSGGSHTGRPHVPLPRPPE
jgi:NAD(P)-dependent dehydrogenase (short-subunit alcohol dehydrogenase family)